MKWQESPEAVGVFGLVFFLVAALPCALLALVLGYFSYGIVQANSKGEMAVSRKRYLKVTAGLVMVLALVGFAAGFYGPIYSASGGNQGPMLGIFVTGPLGAVIGLALSWVYLYWGLRARGSPENAGNE